MNEIGTSYLFWCGWFFGLAGLHRLHNGKVGTGLLWLFTWGLLGVGQVLDLVLIPSLVDERNAAIKAKLGLSPTGVPLPQTVTPETVYRTKVVETIPPPLARDQLMIKLLKAAQARGGKLSVTQGVIDTGASFLEVEATLKDMLKSGYVGVDNHPETGIMIYDFLEL